MTKAPSQSFAEPRALSVWIALEWALLLAGLAALTIREVYSSYASAGLILILASFIIRTVRCRQALPRTGLEIPWALGLVSGAAAAWISYDRSAGILQFSRLIAAAALYYSVVSLTENKLRWPGLGLLVAAAGLAVYWPAHNDFTTQPGKLALITRLGELVNSTLPRLPGPDIHSNVAAGLLLAALPFGLALSWEAWRRRRAWETVLTAGLSMVVLAGLFMTSSRGAWLALFGTLGLAGLAWVQRSWLAHSPSELRQRRQVIFWAAVGLAGAACLAGVLLTGSLDRMVGSLPDPTGGIQSRTVLWREGWQAARDYPFTGSGLMSFWLVHPVYVLLIDVPFIAHAHNTFLEVWVEQGVLGFIGLLLAGGIAASWAWKALGRADVSIWGWAGLGALTAVGLHGLVDVVFYVTRTLPVIGLLFGYAWYLNHPARRGESTVEGRKRTWLWAGLGAAVALAGAALFWRPVLSGWYANLGALEQTHKELTLYNPDRFDTYTLDQVRQDSDLTKALANLDRALVINPDNRVALQRKAEIALSMGEYSAALSAAERLWAAGKRDATTRLIYSDALAAAGRPEEAAKIAAGLTWAEARLQGQAWFRYWINQDYRRAADAWQAVLLLNPQAQGVKPWLEQARAKIK